MCDTSNASTQSIADYLAQLLKDRKQLAAFPNVFLHVERLLEEGKRTAMVALHYIRNRQQNATLFYLIFTEIELIIITCDTCGVVTYTSTKQVT